ncbi:CD225/dispanin family protein [Lutibacter flavus]|uniref:Interferon-induced transmembrane protein n=1 Tax=Lutibacter flavus TaxID=691689 RepID=A0A238VDV0_9FLAO|nr:CD225/dispanin family protein [Lutibacter flavus]SNR31863.1 Interferon-induced transmembrane protein [Lutibacter flavus]
MEQKQPKNYLVESILVTIFCCQPFGIVGIVFASQVNSKFSIGDYEGALKASKNARNWMNWGLIAGILIFVLSLVFMFALGGLAILGIGDF